MARLLVLTDRAPADKDWKGALIWRTILSLAECQHEVLVATPVPFEEISVTHPRLNVIRPVTSWRLDQFPKLAKLFLSYRPEVVHTFALRESRLWPALSVWPLLLGVCPLVPGLKRVATLFESEDSSPGLAAFAWYQSSQRITTFSDDQRHGLGKILARTVEVMPLEFEAEEISVATRAGYTLIPAPVSEWREPLKDFAELAEFLRRGSQAQVQVRIVGGWGDFPQRSRKEIWRKLGSLATQIQLCEPLALCDFLSELHAAESLWLEPLVRDSWKFLLSTQLARQLGKGLIVSSAPQFTLSSGSTANSLSRLYTGL